MKVIYEYPIAQVAGPQGITLPEGDLLHVGLDPTGNICLWILREKHPAWVNWVLEVVATGELTNWEQEHHIGTVVQGSFVWHIFMREA